MKIAILGTRGIPNYYGGFEQFCEYLSLGLAQKGHEVVVYNSSEHPYQDDIYKDVKIKHKPCYEDRLGAFAHFLYDFYCTRDAINNDEFDILLHCGYQSAAPAIWFFRKKKTIMVCNMDGLEWKRDKWSLPVKKLTKYLEKLVVKSCKYLISDNIGIQKYYEEIHNISSKYIAYGSEIDILVDPRHLEDYNVIPYEYNIIVARLEPENNIDTILQAYDIADLQYPILVVGKNNTNYSKYLLEKYSVNKKIRFIGGVYDKPILDSLRKYSKIYFHGHTVGGTNPSLLESMALGCLIVYHNNDFNHSTLKGNGIPFENSQDIVSIIRGSELGEIEFEDKIRKECIKTIRSDYSWQKIINEYESYFKTILEK